MPWVTLSLLDRLLPSRELGGWSASVRDLKIVVRRDLEYLLNTSKPARTDTEDFPRFRGTVLEFGLIEFGGIDIADAGTQTRIAVAVEEAIRSVRAKAHQCRRSTACGGKWKRSCEYHHWNPVAIEFRRASRSALSAWERADSFHGRVGRWNRACHGRRDLWRCVSSTHTMNASWHTCGRRPANSPSAIQK